MMPPLARALRLIGPWRLKILAGTYQWAGGELRITHEQSVDIDPAPLVQVTHEAYPELPLHNPNAGPWKRGALLIVCRRQETAACGALEPDSVSVRLSADPARGLQRQVDFDYGDDWASIWRIAEGAVPEGAPVQISYRCGLPRLDGLYLDAAGRIRYRAGEPCQILPQSPEPQPGESLIARIWVPARTAKLDRHLLFPVLESPHQSLEAVQIAPERAEACLPATLAKLRAGEPIRILAWGDSVTDAEYVPTGRASRWQEQFRRRLQSRFPAARIELLTTAWGGRNCRSFLSEPSGSPYHYQERILDLKPDLVISEFINDTGIPMDELATLYPRFLADFRGIGAEWVILTPHYSRPDWMSIPGEVECDADPRPLVAFLRAFTAEHDLPLADASRLWGRLWRQGLPYTTLLANEINHPDARGLALFADALMPWFPRA